jgi:hypothetical protein
VVTRSPLGVLVLDVQEPVEQVARRLAATPAPSGLKDRDRAILDEAIEL